MANWTILKEAIASVIKTNDNQEITGQLLQNTLNNIITNVGENATFAGIATPTTNPGTPDGPVFYIATTAGSYSNFGSLEVSKGETAILQWNNGTWTKNDIKPMAEFESGIIYDVSANNGGAVFESLSTLLGSANLSTLIPTSVRRGGMSIQFIQGSVPNSDNKYVRYRLMSDTFNATVANWQGVDEVSIIGSKNLATSGSVGNINSELLGINAVLFGGNISKIIPILQSRTNIAYIKVHENETFMFSVATNSPVPTNGVYLVIWNGAERYSTDLIMTQGQTSATLTKVFSQDYELRVELVWNDYSFNDIEVEYSIISNNYIDLVGKLKDGLGTSNIKDGSVTKEKLNKQIYSSLSIPQYEEDIAELYILQKASVGVTHIYCRSIHLI